MKKDEKNKEDKKKDEKNEKEKKEDEKNEEEKKKADEIEEDDLHTAIASKSQDDRVILTIVEEPGILPNLPSKEKIEKDKKAKELEFFRRDQKQVGSAETENIQPARAGSVSRKKQKSRGGKQQAAASVAATPKGSRKRMLRTGKLASARSLRQKVLH
ncbi:unnamed protein product [Cylicostephanus goldi]|uniref:Uncharacterized protein n=1 Tax=Cylicostephanus goldi TaxID=71465 RepID=A0A3P6TMX1_CYLGO|nr:unnamed protein product [Cylicostephanus goldi]